MLSRKRWEKTTQRLRFGGGGEGGTLRCQFGGCAWRLSGVGWGDAGLCEVGIPCRPNPCPLPRHYTIASVYIGRHDRHRPDVRDLARTSLSGTRHMGKVDDASPVFPARAVFEEVAKSKPFPDRGARVGLVLVVAALRLMVSRGTGAIAAWAGVFLDWPAGGCR